jgi:phosphopantothenoylcysteine synthetase/decarboxylase
MNVVVTGGGTIAPIDDVRLMTNISSGRLAAQISEASLDRGATVWHIHALSAVLPLWRNARFDLDATDPSAERERLERLRGRWMQARDRLRLLPLRNGTVADYAETLQHVIEENPIDIVVLPMAVGDFEPEPYHGKIDSDRESLVIQCQRAPKVIRMVRDWSPSVYLVGFKLMSRVSHDELVRRAQIACRKNRVDLTVANDLQTLREGRHTLHLVRPNEDPVSLQPGPDLADRLVDRIFSWALASRNLRRSLDSRAPGA